MSSLLSCHAYSHGVTYITNPNPNHHMTSAFQQSLPSAVLPVSPALAALHVSRARLLDPIYGASVSSTNCAKCGTYILNGDGHIRLGRNRKSTQLLKGCGVCGWNDKAPIPKGNARLFEPSRKVKRQRLDSQRSSGLPPQTQPSPTISGLDTSVKPDAPARVPPKSSTASPTPRPKSRPKKMSALQMLLSRSKEMQGGEKRATQMPETRLADFLSRL
jgi:hypothetical protein